MLHHAQHDLVAGADVRKAKARRNEIDRLSRRSGENDLLVRGGVDEPSHGFSGRLIRLGRSVGEIVQAAMHIRILVLIGVRQAIDDLLRLLSRGGVVQIDKRLSIRALGEDREIRPYRFDVVSVERRLDELVHVFAFTVSRDIDQLTSCPSQAASVAQRIDQQLVLDSVDGLPSKSLEQHRLGVAVRDAPRLQIEHLFGVERSDRRSVSAHDVVGEDLQLRLLIHLRARGQENSLGLHGAIGLLRRFLDDNLSLKHSDRVVIDDRAIEFAAGPGRRSMNDLQRRVGASGAVDKRQSAKRQLRLISGHPDKNLPPRELAARNESKGGKLRSSSPLRRSGFRCAARARRQQPRHASPWLRRPAS